MNQIECNDCGAGKDLYFRVYRDSYGDGVSHWKPAGNISSSVMVTNLEDGCPKCGSMEISPKITE